MRGLGAAEIRFDILFVAVDRSLTIGPRMSIVLHRQVDLSAIAVDHSVQRLIGTILLQCESVVADRTSYCERRTGTELAAQPHYPMLHGRQ